MNGFLNMDGSKKMKIKLIIPAIFVTVNRQYGTARAGRRQIPIMYLTKDAKAYKEIVQWTAKQKYKGKPTKEKIKVKVYYYFKDKRRRDILNDKLTWDSLEDILYFDDKQIDEAHVYRRYDKENPRAEITITTLTHE